MGTEDLKSIWISKAEFNEYHSIDRDLYATLVYDLWRDPVEAIQMMAIWIWLERLAKGFSDLTQRILDLPYRWIDKIGDEALLCWACIDNVVMLNSLSVTDFPLTNVVFMKDVPVKYFRQFREASLVEINEVINQVCANCFKDIWDGAIARNAHIEYLQNTASHESTIAPLPQSTGVQPDNRTLFVTFSRGYPVAESEVREFFTQLFGECIESFYMQEVGVGEHALFAKIVLNHPSYVHVVLNGDMKAKFTINGKHVWMRKFIPKRRP